MLHCIIASILGAIFVLSNSQRVHATQYWVSTTGFDFLGCGFNRTHPCRQLLPVLLFAMNGDVYNLHASILGTYSCGLPGKGFEIKQRSLTFRSYSLDGDATGTQSENNPAEEALAVFQCSYLASAFTVEDCPSITFSGSSAFCAQSSRKVLGVAGLKFRETLGSAVVAERCNSLVSTRLS